MTERDPTPRTTDADLGAVDRAQQSRYRLYRPEWMDYARRDPADYFTKLANRRIALVRAHYRGGRVLDVCSGYGDYVLNVATFADEVIGVDFSRELAAAAAGRLGAAGHRHARVLVANARTLPLRARSIALAYSFSSLYGIPRVEDVIHECSRVLGPGGRALLEFGIEASLNTFVARALSGSAASYPVPFRRLAPIVTAAGLVIEEHHAFQLFPLWGDRPRWLWPLLHPAWRRLFAAEMAGRMVDEWLSSAPLVRRVAFRHLLVCRKAA
ncbi:MAG: methyltransferase domain-containing protein [Candidatus Rokubacteria bacterium]|nr:methyltransferase domain-containing protein [Candidatus Rokubacteria bacterium]